MLKRRGKTSGTKLAECRTCQLFGGQPSCGVPNSPGHSWTCLAHPCGGASCPDVGRAWSSSLRQSLTPNDAASLVEETLCAILPSLSQSASDCNSLQQSVAVCNHLVCSLSLSLLFSLSLSLSLSLSCAGHSLVIGCTLWCPVLVSAVSNPLRVLMNYSALCFLELYHALGCSVMLCSCL